MSEGIRFARFAAVGVIGFVVDGGLLQLLVSGLGSEPITARFVSFPLAVLVTWALNRSFTFGQSNEGMRAAVHSAARYFLVSIGGTLVNFTIYVLLITEFDWLRTLPIVALAVASLAALASNYVGAKFLAFRQG